MEEYVVYVLYSESADRLYIGYSSNSLERFHWHNKRSKKGFTIKHRPWLMIHVEFFDTKQEAMERERKLKGGQGRNWLRSEILQTMRVIGFISA